MQARPSRPSSIRRVLTTGSSRVGCNARTNFDRSGHSSAADFHNSRYAEVRPPSELRSSTTEVIQGNPDPKHISTSYVERLNWSLRTSNRRYTRLSNGFSRKLRNHEAAVALNYFAYNFVRIHRTLRVTPATAAGVTTRPLRRGRSGCPAGGVRIQKSRVGWVYTNYRSARTEGRS